MRTDRLAREYNVTLHHTVFPLHPDTPEEGRTLKDLFAGHAGHWEDMRQRLLGLMESEGLEYGDRTHTYNSRLAQELAKWADSQPGGEAIHMALYRAYFVDGTNLARTDDLIEIAEGLGLPGGEARSVLEARSFGDAVDRDWQRSMEVGVKGVPTFAVGDQGVVGAQPYEVLEQLVVDAGAVKRVRT